MVLGDKVGGKNRVRSGGRTTGWESRESEKEQGEEQCQEQEEKNEAEGQCQ